ncbi:MAG: lysozyme [Leptolyngbyaceae cyanobacterium MAG.088]|nr:lysozyme [Leptolyngbyaceae cyanobacterium MAG.088]
MGTWIKETDQAIYLMQGGYYISKISKYPSKSNPNERVLNVSGMKSWFVRADSPRGMTVSQSGPQPKPMPRQSTTPSDSNNSSSGSSRQTNASGVGLIKSFEGLRLKAYQDAVGVWTIGYGTTRGVKPGQSISEAQAEAFLKSDLDRFEQAVNQAVRIPINDNQFAALVSFTYNVGSGAMRSSTLLKKLNRRDLYGAANEFPRWNRAGGRVLAGLTRRRNAERALFLGQDYRSFL